MRDDILMVIVIAGGLAAMWNVLAARGAVRNGEDTSTRAGAAIFCMVVALVALYFLRGAFWL